MSGAAAELTELCDLLEEALSGETRREIVSSLLGPSGSDPLRRLRGALSAQALPTARGALELERRVRRLDHRTRREGFRVLHSWDHTEHRFTEEITPVLMLDYYDRAAGKEREYPVVLSILLDYYFMHLLALCAMRAWDGDDPDGVLDRLTRMVGLLQGPRGSGHRFVSDAETLIIYALSQFHPEEHAYDRLIEKFAPLTRERRVRFALVSASVLSCHLRWGFWLMYDRDVLRMRNDNVGDYPWLLDSVLTLMREYARLVEQGAERDERDVVVDGLLQGLAADPWAFVDRPPPPLASFAGLHSELRSLLVGHGARLVEELERHRPAKDAYSPLALHFNFPHNTLVAIVATALLTGRPQPLPLNVLFTREHGLAGGDESRPGPAALARALTAYSGESPDRLGAHGALLVAYDPLSGRRSFSMTVDALRGALVPGEGSRG